MKTKLLHHIFSLCLLFTQLSWVPQAQAQTTQIVENEDVIADESVKEADNKRAANQAHEERAAENGGLKTYCEEEDKYGSWGAYDSANAEYQSFVGRNTQALQNQITNLNGQGSNLLGAQNQYLDEHGAFVDPAAPIEGNYDDARQRLADANANLSQVRRDEQMAEAEYNAAQAACNSGRGYCTPQERQRLNNARARWTRLQSDLIAAQQEQRSASRDMRYGAAGRVNDTADGAMTDITDNANGMTQSHAVSGCGGSGDITQNTTQECTLSGPLFENDQELNRIANAGINEAQQMAARRADMLFDLELQQEYAADYKLYQMAVAGGFQEVHKDAGINTLDQVDGLDDNSALKTKNLKLVISNIKTVGLASAAVKDTVCEKHDESEADAKSAYIFKAASATWLMAVVQDTDYFAAESSCQAEEMLTDDENNLQIQTVERAANVKDQMLENLCMRIRPPAPVGDTYDWKIYGDSPEEAARYVQVLNGYTDGGVTYPPLRERCEEYLVELRGEEFRDKPRTRETALEMVREAEALALEELMAKNEKLMIADANVKKGEKWVADVQKRIMIALALYAVIEAAKQMATSVCAGCGPWCGACCGQCPVATSLGIKAAYVIGTLYGVYLVSELMRARAFLAKWREKYRIAQYFTHMACNFETAEQEEAYMASLGERAKAQKEQEVQDAINDATRSINETVNDAVINTQRPPASTFIDKINSDVQAINSEQDLISFFSKKVFVKPVKNITDLKNRLKKMGLDVLTGLTMSDAHATTPAVNRRDVNNNANALNISEGTESFRYFLVQRNLQFQNQTNDITNQPNHTRSDSAIANAGGSNKKNKAGGVIRSVEDLAQAHLDGRVMDAVSDLPKEQQTGFPTPETRYLTIQNARMIFEENINLLNGGITELAWQRDQTVQLLNDMRRRMTNNKQGMGETQLIPGGAPKPVCMVGDVSSINFDPTCGCADEDSCASFDFPQFTPSTPNALKTGGRLATSTTNSLLSGDLSGAALDGGRLVANGAAVRKDLFERQNDFNQANRNGSSTKKASDVAQDLARGLNDTTENEASSNLASIGVDRRGGFNSARISMLKGDQFGKEDDASKNLKDELGKGSGFGRGARAVASVGGKGSDKDKIKDETFSLGGTGNLNLEGLTDEERARLGLGDGMAMKGKGGSGYGKDGQKYGHVRSLSARGSGNNLDKSDPFYGINKNRGRDLFKIISNRYEKTAFPVLLDFN